MVDLEKGGQNLASSANVFKFKGQSRLIITLNTEGDCKTIHCKLSELPGNQWSLRILEENKCHPLLQRI